MGLRITTWNVNGIRNPFGYQPWRDKRSFAAMFDILEADIVVFQETKIQRKDLSDDMVLVPGWDCYFSLPRHKKGYSGVVIYTRQSVCAPIRAEEGITGILCPPTSSTSFRDLPDEGQIGGYPTSEQLATSTVDATTLDSEGRCVILEFPAFVLLGVYSPANRDETRDDYRLGFLDVLDSRIRNLVAIGKRVFLTGDLNISREEIDAANAEASMRKQGLTGLEFVSTPARRLLNQLLEGGKVYGDRDEGRESPILWDLCRAFHQDRKGMFTCWEQKVNARPGNCGARIDYVLCSLAMKGWFVDANIQEGLMGSDHCPVYAIMNDKVYIDGSERHVQDVMNPPSMFVGGIRQREYSITNDPLPLSGKLIPEFFGRRNIKDMFSRKPSLQQSQSTAIPFAEENLCDPDLKSTTSVKSNASKPQANANQSSPISATRVLTGSPSTIGKKRAVPDNTALKNTKRSKSSLATPAPDRVEKGQQSLKGFFKPKLSTTGTVNSPVDGQVDSKASNGGEESVLASQSSMNMSKPNAPTNPDSGANTASSSFDDNLARPGMSEAESTHISPSKILASTIQEAANVHDPIETKETWSKLFTKPVAPRCEGHDEPCISLLTKKPGMNLGRSFWMCPRPLGPSGAKEKNTQWRCQTFIWCSDWNPNSTEPG